MLESGYQSGNDEHDPDTPRSRRPIVTMVILLIVGVGAALTVYLKPDTATAVVILVQVLRDIVTTWEGKPMS